VCGRVCVIEKKLQERFRKVSFADSEKLETIVRPGQGAPTHREQNLRGLSKAHERAAPSNAKKSEHIVWTAVAGLSGGGTVNTYNIFHKPIIKKKSAITAIS